VHGELRCHLAGPHDLRDVRARVSARTVEDDPGAPGGIAGDIHGLPACRLAVVPGTTHSGLCDRAAWVVPMLADFLDAP